MKPFLTGPCKPFLEALAVASLGLPSRASLPALTLVRIVASPDGVTLLCDCLDAAVQVSVPDLKCKEAKTISVSPRLLRASLRGEDFTMEVEDGKLLVDSGGRSVIALGAEVMPDPRKPIQTHEIDPKPLMLGLKCGLNCSDPQPDSPRNGVVWEHGMRGLVGGDGKVIHATNCDLGFDHTLIVPRFSASLLQSLVSWDEPLFIGLERSTLYVEQGNARAWMQLVGEAKVGSVQRAFDLTPDKTCSVGREELQKALESLEPFVSASLGKVKVHVMKEKVVFSAQHDGNKSSASVECVLGGNEEKFSVLLSSLSKAFRHWTCDTLSVHKAENGIQLKPDDQSGCEAFVILVREDV